MSRLAKSVERLLDIHAPSGHEKPVRDYLKPILNSLMDSTEIDKQGNLLGIKKLGDDGVIMLSAHMDTVSFIEPDKIVIETFGSYFALSTDGERTVLGADDRAGIAIILEVLETIPNSFKGTIKVAFTVGEEEGQTGSKGMSDDFLSDVNLAIVVDREGSRDIVTSCFMPFCSLNVQLFVVETAYDYGMGYECVSGGISDAVSFAEKGINSINLSAGYYNEHTESERLVLKDMEDTVELIGGILFNLKDEYKKFGKIPKLDLTEEENWDEYTLDDLM